MSATPAQPKLYHITHVDNVAGIAIDGCLASDASMLARDGPAQAIGMSAIKRRRVEKLEVHPHPGTKVGDYVPFYFCPRSVMLYVIHCANHPELAYKGGQDPIVHFEADLHEAVRWATLHGVRWAFSLSNAGAYYTEFRARVEALNDLDWDAIAAHDFRAQRVKECKQAEFLLHGSFPFNLVERVGVHSPAVERRVQDALALCRHRPRVEVLMDWYF